MMLTIGDSVKSLGNLGDENIEFVGCCAGRGCWIRSVDSVSDFQGDSGFDEEASFTTRIGGSEACTSLGLSKQSV